jgi:serpin B
VVSGLADRQVNLSLPRFDIESRTELTSLMQALGMNLAFEPGTADFSAMTAQEQLFVGFIVHQANITVDEEGTEAAAATAVGVGVTSAPTDPPVDVVADRPFIFAIRDTVTGCLVFMGRVGDPG